MTYLIIYLVAVFIFIFIDAMLCASMHKRFVFFDSLMTSLIFPISASIVIWYVGQETKNFDLPKKTFDE